MGQLGVDDLMTPDTEHDLEDSDQESIDDHMNSPTDEDDGFNDYFSLPPTKRQRVAGVATLIDKRLRCRERNRLHARNTRERKKNQLSSLQCAVLELYEERKMLQDRLTSASVASLLLVLAGRQDVESAATPEFESSERILSETSCGPDAIEAIKEQVSQNLVDDAFEIEMTNFGDSHSSVERQRVRRERNRMHARKTRQRKKLILLELENLVRLLATEVHQLRERVACQHAAMCSNSSSSTASIASGRTSMEASVPSSESVAGHIVSLSSSLYSPHRKDCDGDLPSPSASTCDKSQDQTDDGKSSVSTLLMVASPRFGSVQPWQSGSNASSVTGSNGTDSGNNSSGNDSDHEAEYRQISATTTNN